MGQSEEGRLVRRLIAVLAALTALTAVVGGSAPARAQEPEPPPEPEPRFQPFIVGGEPVPPGETPWMVALLDAHGGNQFCGASLVAPSWVLTAAHCTSDPAPPVVDALLGQQRLSASGGERIRVAEALRHPQFHVPNIPVNDVALLRLTDPSAQPTLGVVPAGFEGAWKPGTEATAYGWGSRDPAGGNYPDELQRVTLPIQSDQDCRSANGSWFQGSSMLCAGTLESSGRDACDGDSGGPLVVPFGWGVAQVGVTSWGSQPCASPGQPGVFAEVPRFANWITHHTKYGPLGQTAFIFVAFFDYLDRAPTPDDFNFWRWVMTFGVEPGALIAHLNQSDRWQWPAGSLSRLYLGALQRFPDTGGLEYWIRQMRNGQPLDAIANYFVSSPEFRAKYGSLDNGQFVDRVFSNVLGRQPNSWERADWIHHLERGLSRGWMMLAFSEGSPEFRNAHQASIDRTTLFFGSIRRMPNAAERRWIGAQSLQAVGNAIPNNLEYNRRY